MGKRKDSQESNVDMKVVTENLEEIEILDESEDEVIASNVPVFFLLAKDFPNVQGAVDVPGMLVKVKSRKKGIDPQVIVVPAFICKGSQVECTEQQFLFALEIGEKDFLKKKSWTSARLAKVLGLRQFRTNRRNEKATEMNSVVKIETLIARALKDGNYDLASKLVAQAKAEKLLLESN
jgi:hypothetical protein